jgi:DNA repair protein RecN (Recombination protein N)
LVTATFLKRLAPYLVDIHGQGEQFSLFDPASHLNLVDEYARNEMEREQTTQAYHAFSTVKNGLAALKNDEAEKLQLVDILTFQVGELERANLKAGEDEELDDEKRRLNNVEKLSALSTEAFALLYENDGSASASFEKAGANIQELAEYDSRFRDQSEAIENARALIEDLSIATRDFLSSLEFSPNGLKRSRAVWLRSAD